ncbi:MAG: hypothetical protein WBI07_21475 [Mobilitalea sp.]
MKIKKVINIEDTILKHVAIKRELESEGIRLIVLADNAEKGIKEIEQAEVAGEPYDLLVCDMHFNFFGKDDTEAGEKTLKHLREKGIKLPVVFCSSQNWQIQGSIGTVFYNEQRYWEQDMREMIKKVEAIL